MPDIAKLGYDAVYDIVLSRNNQSITIIFNWGQNLVFHNYRPEKSTYDNSAPAVSLMNPTFDL